MTARVVNVGELLRTHGSAALPAIYVGRAWPGHLPAHPLANPFKVGRYASREEREGCLVLFVRWLDLNPDRDRLLAELADEVKRTGLPLACWCGEWPEDPDLVCHGVELARRVNLILARQGDGR